MPKMQNIVVEETSFVKNFDFCWEDLYFILSPHLF